jgi:large subunit ribosomal protein L13
MDTIIPKTYSSKTHEMPAQRKWFIVDAKDQVLGKLAVTVANKLRGRNKPFWSPHVDCGDFVVIINAKEVKLTGKKETQKQYVSVSGYIGGKKVRTPAQLREKHSDEIVRHAVWGMIPHGPLGREVMAKLKIYAGSEHPHDAQQPEALAIAGR